jgi:hypothetical protein
MCSFPTSGSSVVLAFATGALSYKDRMLFLPLNKPGQCHTQFPQDYLECRPGETPFLPTTSIEPLVVATDGIVVKAVHRVAVAAYPEVVVVAHQFAIQRFIKLLGVPGVVEGSTLKNISNLLLIRYSSVG